MDKDNVHIIIILAVIVAVLGAWDAYHYAYFIGKDKSITLEYLLGFLVMITAIYLFWRRAINREKQIEIQAQQIEIQVKKEIDDRFTTAVGLLGSSETSVRTGAIYALYQQAVEHEKYRKQIVRMLCSHIRSKTQEPAYQQQHKNKPSNEIQTAINLLFRETENTGLYPQFGQELSNANLSYAYCVGANFAGAHCQGADFWYADFQRADFGRGYCQGTNFWGSHFEGADFIGAHCQGASFRGAHCQGARFSETDCQGAYSSISSSRFTADSIGKGSKRGLADRIGRDTELELVVEGALSQRSIDAIEDAKEYHLPHWYSEMQRIIEDNKDKEEKRDIPEGIISGVLEDSEGLQKIIKELEDMWERRQFQLFNYRHREW